MGIDWEKLRLEYIRNPTKSMEDVAAEAKVDATNLKRTASEQGWFEQKKEYQKVVHDKTTAKLLSSIADEDSDNIAKRTKIRLESWHLIESNIVAIVSNLDVIDHSTGLPRKLMPSELERASKILRESTNALEKAHSAERSELDYRKDNKAPWEFDQWGVPGKSTYEQFLDAITTDELHAEWDRQQELKKLREQEEKNYGIT